MNVAFQRALRFSAHESKMLQTVLKREDGDAYAVESGLSEGERVIASANFLIDSEATVQGALADFRQH